MGYGKWKIFPKRKTFWLMSKRFETYRMNERMWEMRRQEEL